MTMTDKMLAGKEGRVGTMTFNNPARHNAVSLEMWQAGTRILEEFARDDDVRVLVVTGAGGKAFVSGADISKFEDERATREAVERYNAIGQGFYTALSTFPKPTIAAIQGYCIGGGLNLAIGCDLRFCTEGSRFALPAAKLGLGYGYAGLQRFIDTVGPAQHQGYLLLRPPVRRRRGAGDGRRQPRAARGRARALRQGVRRHHRRECAADHRRRQAVGHRGAQARKRAQPEARRRLVARCFASQDYIEGRTAFMEKRKPKFTGK